MVTVSHRKVNSMHVTECHRVQMYSIGSCCTTRFTRAPCGVGVASYWEPPCEPQRKNVTSCGIGRTYPTIRIAQACDGGCRSGDGRLYTVVASVSLTTSVILPQAFTRTTRRRWAAGLRSRYAPGIRRDRATRNTGCTESRLLK